MPRMQTKIINEHGVDIAYFNSKLTDLRRAIVNGDYDRRQIIMELANLQVEAGRIKAPVKEEEGS